MVTPSFFISNNLSITLFVLVLSKDAVGSSSKSTDFGAMIPFAIFTLCCSPPLKVKGEISKSSSFIFKN